MVVVVVVVIVMVVRVEVLTVLVVAGLMNQIAFRVVLCVEMDIIWSRLEESEWRLRCLHVRCNANARAKSKI